MNLNPTIDAGTTNVSQYKIDHSFSHANYQHHSDRKSN